jgi:DNA-directed RNA polymerase specialized sigma24 family protein
MNELSKIEPNGMGDVCPRCSHFKSCRVPCFPMAEYLKRGNLTVFEKSHTDENGRTVTVLFPRSREMVESDLPQESGETAAKYQRAFSTEAENPFSEFAPSLKQTGIFVDKFFNGFSYEDLAVKYDMTVDTAQGTYRNAMDRVLEILNLMESDKPLDQSHYRKRMEERSGRIPKDQKYFLLNKLFGVRPAEIAEMEGLKGASSVKQLIIRVSDQLRAGEIRLIDFTPEHAAAQVKDRRAAQRRERYHQDLEASRARQRERYHLKKAKTES